MDAGENVEADEVLDGDLDEVYDDDLINPIRHYIGDHPVKLDFHHVLFKWLPYFKESTLAWDLEGPARYDHRVDDYAYQCGLGPMLMPCIEISRDDYDYDLLRKLVAIWRQAVDLLLAGDYYPLTPIHRTAERWVARQFDCPEEGSGFIQGIRLPACPQETFVGYTKALLPGGVYLLEHAETGEIIEKSGAALMQDGFTFRLLPRSSVIWLYNKKD